MDRRSFLKNIGVGLSSCYLPVPTAEADQSLLLGALAVKPSHSPQSIKVISLGNDKSLVESMQWELSFCSKQISIEFIAIQGTTEIPIPNTRAIQLPFAGSRVLYDSSGSVRRMAIEKQDEIKAVLSGADLVLLAVSLDSDIAFGACDFVAKLARHSGALTVALVVTPLIGSEGMGGITKVHAERVSKQAINEMLTQADCVHAANGWGSDDICSWGYIPAVAYRLMFASGLPLSTAIDSQLRSLFTQSGQVRYGDGYVKNAGESVDKAVCDAVDPKIFYNYWDKINRKIPTAASGLVVVSAHPEYMSDSIASVRAAITSNQPLKSTGSPYWRENSKLIYLARPQDFYDPVRGNMSVEIISTDIVYENL